MPAELRVDYRGYPELIQTFRALPRTINRATNRGVQRATIRIAKDLRRQVKLVTPEDTGRLRRAIKVRRERKRPGYYRLEVYAREAASRGGQTLRYFYIVEARTMFVSETFRRRLTRYQRILNVEVARSIQEALRQ